MISTSVELMPEVGADSRLIVLLNSLDNFFIFLSKPLTLIL